MASAATQCTAPSYGGRVGSRPSERNRYSANGVAIAPSADARISSSSDQPNRNAGSRPKPSRTYTYTPPERGNIAASSAYVSAPHNASSPPNTHTSSISTGSGTRPAITAGVRSEEHTSELQSQSNLVCRLLLEKKKRR